jgi:hypothetical protein
VCSYDPSFLSYRRSQASVKPINATNVRMVTRMIIRSSIHILLISQCTKRMFSAFQSLASPTVHHRLDALCCRGNGSPPKGMTLPSHSHHNRGIKHHKTVTIVAPVIAISSCCTLCIQVLLIRQARKSVFTFFLYMDLILVPAHGSLCCQS